jgi:hypothetical protein
MAHTTSVETRKAHLIQPGDVLTDTEGRYRRTVTDVDHTTNVHGRVVIRTGSGSTIAAPDTDLHVVSCAPHH